jgi:hypothetical protein
VIPASSNPESPESISENIRVVSGSPTAEELAAVIAVIEQARQEQAELGKREKQAPRSTWVRNASILRTGVEAGSGQWRASYKEGL